MTARIALEGETDYSQITVELQNAVRTYSVDTAADGSVRLTGIVPGAYRLSVRTRYFVPLTDTVAIDLGETHDLGQLSLAPKRSLVSGSALSQRIVNNVAATQGGVAIRLEKTGSIRGAATAPSLWSNAVSAQPTAPIYTTVSSEGGAYQFAGVPAGAYAVVAGAAGVGETRLAEVTVTGEQDVLVTDILRSPAPSSGRFSTCLPGCRPGS